MRKLLIALLCGVPGFLFAQGSQVNLQSPKSVGMGGAGSAYFLDESSIFYSPGALAKVEDNGIFVAGNLTMFKSAFQETGSSVVNHTKNQITPPFSVFATLGPKQSWWKAGIGIYTPYGGAVDWGTEWIGKFSLVSLSLRAIYVQPTVSFKLSDKFSVGGGFVYNIGQVNLKNSVPVFYEDGRSGLATLSGTGTGMGYNVGIHYNLDEEFSFSLSYRSKVNTKLNGGDAKFEVPASVAANFPEGNKFDAELPLPATLAAGVAFPLSSKVKAAIDGSYIFYDIYKGLNFDYEKNTPVLQDSYLPKNYTNAGSIKAGVEYLASDKLQLRAGGGFIFTPVQKDFVYPETPDNNRVLVSGGLSYRINQKLDLTGSFAYQRILARQATNVDSHLAGTYATNVYAPGIGISYKW